VVGVRVIEPEQVHVPLGCSLLELLYLRRLDEETPRALLPMGVFRAPNVDHDLHLPDIHPNERPCALLGIGFSSVFVDVAHIPPAYLERQRLILLPETL
jgi:hypothetical protein